MRTYTAAGGIRGSVGWYKEALTTTDQFAAAIARGKLTLPMMGMRLPLTLAAEQEDDGKKYMNWFLHEGRHKQTELVMHTLADDKAIEMYVM